MSDTKTVSFGENGEVIEVRTVDITKTSLPNIIYDKYVASDASKDVASKYENALWILEHSYPTLDLNETLNAAGVDKDLLKTQIKELQKKASNVTPAENYTQAFNSGALENYGKLGLTPFAADQTKANATDAELNELLENYVYSTVQYAIWKVNGKEGLGNC